MSKLILAPSILSADFACLNTQLQAIEKAGAAYLHLDVMDGHFVPNISIGIPVVQSLRKETDMVFDVHLMISNPKAYVQKFAQAGSDIITFHMETCGDSQEVYELINLIKSAGNKVGISLKPDTPLQSVYEFIEHIDMVLLMSVNPGFGGQDFIKSSLEKAYMLRNYADSKGIMLDIEMDGGINLDNMRDVIDAGVNVIVVGSAIFKETDIFHAAQKYINIFEEYK